MLSDVIAAIATPPGRSAIALLRVAGNGAHEVAARVLEAFAVTPYRCARLARVVHPGTGEILDLAQYVTYGAPSSYCGQDMVEISTHGGLLVPVEVLSALLAAGARPAAPGEFTRRAILNGKMDLLQAESVGDLVDATAPAQRRAALAQMDRRLSRHLADLRARFLEIEALVAYDIDFPEEDSGPVSEARVRDALAAARDGVARLLETAREGERLREGALIIIAGRPNVGKSSLFNALVGHERAIVTDVPGTTRDAIESPVSCDGFPVRLIDTAGLRGTADLVEQLGVQVSRRYIERADVLLFCSEADRELEPEERAFLEDVRAPVVQVRTKADLAPDRVPAPGAILVSTVAGTGLDQLRRELARQAFGFLARGTDLEPVVTRERHRVALQTALDELDRFAVARASGVEAAVAAAHLRGAVSAVEEIIGVVTPDDVLERVFASFCVGK
jgi:tRNA modification GTPase